MPFSDKMMKRITMTVKASRIDGGQPQSTESFPFACIYGIGSAGLTPFERAVASLEPGQSVEVAVAGNTLGVFFGCHSRHIGKYLHVLQQADAVSLAITLSTCEEASPQEVVKAISSSLSGGCASGGCGCGCG